MRFARTEIGAKSASWRHLHGAQKGSGLLGGKPLVNGVKTVMVNETLMLPVRSRTFPVVTCGRRIPTGITWRNRKRSVTAANRMSTPAP